MLNRFTIPAEAIPQCVIAPAVTNMATGMNVDSSAASATAEPTATPSMVAERPVGEIPSGARAYFQPMLNAAKAEIMKEIATEFDKAMSTNCSSLNESLETSQKAMKSYMDNSASELIQKIDTYWAPWFVWHVCYLMFYPFGRRG